MGDIEWFPMSTKDQITRLTKASILRLYKYRGLGPAVRAARENGYTLIYDVEKGDYVVRDNKKEP